MSRVFKADRVCIGVPKAIENNIIVLENKLEKTDIQEVDIIKESQAKADALLEDAKQMYIRILDEANLEAAQILEKARQEAENIKKSEKEKGYIDGYQEGKKAAEVLLKKAEEIRLFLDSRKESIVKEIEPEVVNVILDIAKKIIGQELSQNNEVIYSLVKQALSKITYKNKLNIRVSPSNFELINSNKDRIKAMVEGMSEIEVYSDPSLNEGGCIIETPSGEVNSSVDIQMAELEKMFLYVLGNE